MNVGPREAYPSLPQSGEMEFRDIFRVLDETGQDRLLDTARALSFAAKARSPYNRGEPWKREGEAGNNRIE